MSDLKKEAREQGFNAQRRGDSQDANPHSQGTDLYASWREGWMLAGMSITDWVNAAFDAALAQKS